MKRCVLLLAFAMVGVLVVGCSGPAAAPPPPAEGAKPSGGQAAQPPGPADIARYTGADRQKLLEEGAKKEGKLVWYTSTTHNPAFKAAFEKQYPFVTVEVYRADTSNLVRKVVEEYQANVYQVDAFEVESSAMAPLKRAGVLQPYASPEASAFPKETHDREGYFVISSEAYQSLGYNTKLLKEEELPKTQQDYLDPRWKGKMAIPGSSTGVRFIGSVLLLFGEDYVRKLAGNDVRLVQASGRALSDMVIAGEFPLSPTIFDSHVIVSSKEGAPFGWKVIEPVVTNTTAPAIAAKPVHPYAAALFMDWLLAKEGQQVYIERGFSSPRQGMPGTKTYKKHYLEQLVDDYEKEFAKWQQLMKLFAVKQ